MGFEMVPSHPLLGDVLNILVFIINNKSSIQTAKIGLLGALTERRQEDLCWLDTMSTFQASCAHVLLNWPGGKKKKKPKQNMKPEAMSVHRAGGAAMRE